MRVVDVQGGGWRTLEAKKMTCSQRERKSRKDPP